MSRRGKGEGSIYFNDKLKLWTAACRVSSTGRRQRRVAYGHSRREAADKLKALLERADTTPSGETVAAYLTRWLGIIQPSVKPRSHAKFEQVIRLHIIPAIGNLKLDKLSPLQVQEFISTKNAAHMAPQSVIHLRNTLRNAFNHALRLRLLDRNPATNIEVPRLPDHLIQPFTPAEAERLLDAAKESRLEAFYTLALATGARRGELLGLKWVDIDFESSRLTISRALQRIEGQKGLHLTETKTRSANRTVRLPQFAVAALLAHHTRQLQERLISGPDWRNLETNLIFTNRDGLPLEPIQLHRDYKAVLKRANLPVATRVHDLRHSAASLLLAKGVPLKLVQNLLGHSSIAVTSAFYAHIADEMKQQAADAMDAMFGEV